MKLRSKLRFIIPSALIIVWLVVAGIGGPYFGRVEEVSKLDLAAFLPDSAEATKVQKALPDFRNTTSIPAIVVLEAKDGSISLDDAKELSNTAQKITELDGVTKANMPVITSQDKQAAIITPQIEDIDHITDVTAEIKTILNNNVDKDYRHYVAGPAGFSSDLGVAFSGIDGMLLIVALAVVFVILVTVYRSPLLPLFVLMSSVIALTASILIVWNGAKAGWFDLNGQVQGILFILVIGAATDYSLLLVSRYREELYRYKNPTTAIIKALKGTLEPILASGATVIVGLLCLLLSDLGSNKALGPVGSIGILMALATSLTFLPAVLALTGRAGFWPRAPKADKAALKAHELQEKRGFWPKVGKFVTKYPRRIWIGTTVALLIACVGVFQLKADGIPQSDFIMGYSESREGQNILNKHFPSGSGSPALILTAESALDQIIDILNTDSGVANIGVMANNTESGIVPVGKTEQKLKDDIAAQIAKNPVIPAAARQAVAEQAWPFKNAEQKVVDGNVMLQVTLVDQPDSNAAAETIKRLRSTLKNADTNVIVGGTTAIQLDTDTASIKDRLIIIPAVLVAITIILMLLLRSIIAPLLLLITTVVSFGTTLGVSALVFNNILGFPGADPSVILYGFVFLVALGIDYNIFLMTRVREEAISHSTKKGVIGGLVVTGGVITSAGIVLAATFAALAVLPVVFLVQLAFIVAFGVLLDTLIVRSLLVPALIRDLGGIVWWPSKLRKK